MLRILKARSFNSSLTEVVTIFSPTVVPTTPSVPKITNSEVTITPDSSAHNCANKDLMRASSQSICRPARANRIKVSADFPPTQNLAFKLTQTGADVNDCRDYNEFSEYK